MKKIFFISFFAIFLSTPLFAALPPLAESIKEIDAILWSKELSQYFTQSHPIESIEYEDGSYIVTSGGKRVAIDVIYLPSQRIGPREFKLVFKALDY